MQLTNRRPEILAPVGTIEMCLAAIHNGTDAIYLGFPFFNARGRTQDFTIDELRSMIELCHLYGVKVFLALNVLIFEKELEEVEALLRDVLLLHPDALIVQDVGLIRLIKQLCPDQVVHASTQMTVTNHQAIEITADLDINRYVLGREVSIKEMSAIRAATNKELEVFVHGALCVAYSGQCLTSESHGGRSANRGQCAQSCRLEYKLLVDGEVRDLGDKRHLVSPQDLCGIEDVPRLVELGIDSFKIEGRLKSPEYVASTVRNYKEVAEQALAGQVLRNLDARIDELGLTFARGRFNGWLDGVNHQKLVDARISKPHGILLGSVRKVDGQFIEVLSERLPQIGDGVVFRNFDEGSESGGIIFGAERCGTRSVRLRLGTEFSTSRIAVGMWAFCNSSSSLDKRLRQSFTAKDKLKRIPIHMVVSGSLGGPLCLVVRDEDGREVQAKSTAVLEAAKAAPLSCEGVQEEITALSATPFYAESFEFQLTEKLFIHHRELKQLRRSAIDSLVALRTRRPPRTFAPLLSEWRKGLYAKLDDGLRQARAAEIPQLHVLIRDESQLEALEGLPLGTVYLDFEFNKEYEQALATVRDLGFRGAIATTRILKPGELGHLKYIERLRPDSILIRNLGALQYFQKSSIDRIADFSLNISNGLTAHWFLDRGVSRVTPSYDLNSWQLFDLLAVLPPASAEVTVHQYMPAFHMEHCVYAAFLSSGTSYRDCGRPCEKHRVALVDRDGVEHPLKPDAECRNTMFQGKPQAALRLVPELLLRGVRSFRVEALFERPEELRKKLEGYAALIHGKRELQEIAAELGLVERYGVTEGQLFNNTPYRDKKKGSLAVI